MPYTLYNNNNSMDEIYNFRDIEISQRISSEEHKHIHLKKAK